MKRKTVPVKGRTGAAGARVCSGCSEYLWNRGKVCVSGKSWASGRGSEEEQAGWPGSAEPGEHSRDSASDCWCRGKPQKARSSNDTSDLSMFLKLLYLLCGKRMLVGKKWKEGYHLQDSCSNQVRDDGGLNEVKSGQMWDLVLSLYWY